MPIYEYDDPTTIYEAAFQYKIQPGMDVSGVSTINTTENTITIPLLLTNVGGLTRKAVPVSVAVLPGLDVDGNTGSTFGGSLVSEGSNVFPRATYEGTIDTPLELVDGNAVPALIVNGIRYHYAALIIAFMEGRAATQTALSAEGIPVSYGWTRTDPDWFRDPFGRQYNSPKITDFTAQFVEGAPERTTITMELMI